MGEDAGTPDSERTSEWLICLIGLYCFYQYLDAVLTYAGLNHFGLHEANPLFVSFGFLLAFKAIAGLCLSALFSWWFLWGYRRFAIISLAMLSSVSMAICLNNLMWILMGA